MNVSEYLPNSTYTLLIFCLLLLSSLLLRLLLLPSLYSDLPTSLLGD
ncbi:hypothetical protein SAMN04488576_104281 [Bacillus sp. cl25]|nr:hypothetical protein SAMN04488578_103281 [Bacillus sp. cl96]SEA30109.1 hypothetical protein SAMN04488575_103281 [Bacillus sp. cl115]SHJ51674.1 hypothetical protein SAMN04488576_104281 [Bacillus sp. cl25]